MMIALREGLTLQAFGDDEGYCCNLTGVDDAGNPIRLWLKRQQVDRLLHACEEARREHEALVGQHVQPQP